MDRIGIAVDSVKDVLGSPPHNQFGFLGVDFLIDENLKPWLIEMTQGPNAHYSEKITFFPVMLEELFDIVFEIKEKRAQGETTFDNLSSPKGWKRLTHY